MKPINYFEALDPMTTLVQRIKGEYRRAMVELGVTSGHANEVPEIFLEHELPEGLKSFFQAQHPQMRGGEDLPDLAPGEVEVARLVLLNSVHGEVTSLRARRLPNGRIGYALVDEYDTIFELPITASDGPLTDEQVLAQFRDVDPSPMDTGCTFGFRSLFHPDLDELAAVGAEDDDDEAADDEDQ